MFASKRAAARWSVRAALVALAAGTLVLPAVAVAQPQPTAPTPGVSAAQAQANQLRQEVRSGTLLRTHGTVRACNQCDAQVVTTAPGSRKPLATAVPAGNGPADLAAAYSLPATSTSTNTIAIIDAGVDATLASDLATYRSTFGLAPCTVASGCLRLENFNGMLEVIYNAAKPESRPLGSGGTPRLIAKGGGMYEVAYDE